MLLTQVQQKNGLNLLIWIFALYILVGEDCAISVMNAVLYIMKALLHEELFSVTANGCLIFYPLMFFT